MRCNTQAEVYRALGVLHHLQGAALWFDVIRIPAEKKRGELAAFHDVVKFVLYGAPSLEVVERIVPEIARYSA
jgi:hypothetical protein